MVARTSATVARRVYNVDAVSLRAVRPLSWRFGLLADFGAGTTTWLASFELCAQVLRDVARDDVASAACLSACLLASFLIGAVTVRRFVDLHPGTVRLLSAAAIASFWLEGPLRHVALDVGVAADQMCQWCNLYERSERRRRALSGLLLAFVAIHLMLMRHDGAVRVFTSVFLNLVAVSLTLFAAAWSGIERAASLSLLEQQLSVRPADLSWISPSLALGATLFLFTWLAREFTSATRLVELPLVSGGGGGGSTDPIELAPTVALLIGVVIAFVRPQFVRSVRWLLLGLTAGALFFAQTDPHIALAGASTLVVFSAALLPTMMAEMTRTRLLGRAASTTMCVFFGSIALAPHYSVLLPALFLIALQYAVGGFKAAVETPIHAPERSRPFLPRRELMFSLAVLLLSYSPTVLRRLRDGD